MGAGQEGPRFTPAPEAVVLTPQGCYEKVKQWFADNKHVLGTVGMCLLITQVRGPSCQRGGGDSLRETPPRRACAPHPGPARASSRPPEPWTCAGLAGRAGWDRPVPPQARGPLLPCESTAWHQCEQGPGAASSRSVPPQHLCECVTLPTASFLCLCFHICVVGSITGHFLALCGFDTWHVGPGGHSGRASSPWSAFCGWLCRMAQHGRQRRMPRRPSAPSWTRRLTWWEQETPPSFWAQEHWGLPPRPVVCNSYPWGAPVPDRWVHREMDVLLDVSFLP